jgi:hypothetical protein
VSGSQFIPHRLRHDLDGPRWRRVEPTEGRVGDEIRQLKEVRLAGVLGHRIIQNVASGTAQDTRPEHASGGPGAPRFPGELAHPDSLPFIMNEKDRRLMTVRHEPLDPLKQSLPSDITRIPALVLLRRLCFVENHSESQHSELRLETHRSTVDGEPGRLAEMQTSERTAVVEQVVGLQLSADWNPERGAEMPPKADHTVECGRPCLRLYEDAPERVCERPSRAGIPRLVDVGKVHERMMRSSASVVVTYPRNSMSISERSTAESSADSSNSSSGSPRYSSRSA